MDTVTGFLPFLGRRIAVLGLGKAGLPAAQRLRHWGADVTVWDDRQPARDAAEAAGLTLRDPAAGEWDRDTLLMSPGIPHRLPRPHPAAARALAEGASVLGDVDLLFQAVRASGSRARFVGITGTNGKSTTTALTQHILTRAGRTALAGANLGPAALSLDLLGDDGLYVLEMSSYALERLRFVRFEQAAMLNLSPDHLERHGDMAGYAAAKREVFARQEPGDAAIVGIDDAASRALAATLPRFTPISGTGPAPGGVWNEDGVLRDDAGPLFRLAEAPTLPGTHNAQNAAAAAAIALNLGVPRDALPDAMRAYPGLPHRQERVGEIDGVAFINDSKATNADSTERALASYDRVVWIAGGVPKADGIAPLAPYFPRIARAFLIGECADAFAETLAAAGVPHEVVGTLDNAVPAAAAAARAGAAPVVLLSPACASWDQFTGFDQRGDRFRSLVASLPGASR